MSAGGANEGVVVESVVVEGVAIGFDRAAAALARAQLARGVSVRLVARGGSMWPFLLSGDVLTLAPGRRARLGDIVLVELPGVEFGVIHRVVGAVPGRICTKGDALPLTDGWVERARIVARVDHVHRGAETFVPFRFLPLPVSLLGGLWRRLARTGSAVHSVRP